MAPSGLKAGGSSGAAAGGGGPWKGLAHLNVWDNGIGEEGRRALKALVRSRQQGPDRAPKHGADSGSGQDAPLPSSADYSAHDSIGASMGRDRSASVLRPVPSVGLSVLKGLARAHTEAQGGALSMARVDSMSAGAERDSRNLGGIHVHFMY